MKKHYILGDAGGGGGREGEETQDQPYYTHTQIVQLQMAHSSKAPSGCCKAAGCGVGVWITLTVGRREPPLQILSTVKTPSICM